MRYRVCWIAFSLVLAAAAVSAETFFLQDGTVVEGTVLRSLGNTLTIKLDNAGMYQLPLSSIDRAEIAVSNGGLITGSLAWWVAGVYVLATSDGLVEIKDGVINKVSDTAQPTGFTVEDVELDVDVEAPAPAASSLTDEQAPMKFKPTM